MGNPSWRKLLLCVIGTSVVIVSVMNVLSGMFMTVPSPAEIVPSNLPERADSSHCEGLCSCFNQRSSDLQTVAGIWRQYSNTILDVSVDLDEAGDKPKEYQEWLDYLFSWTTVTRLQKSVETMPMDRAALQSIVKILEKGERPLQVAIFGGSLTAGHGCLENPIGLPTQSFLKRQLPCAWPARLQGLLQRFAPSLQINITNMAMAATTSDVGATVLDYQLWPPELQPHGPDVLIAAFAINDALAELTEPEIYQNMQQLITSVQREQNCRNGAGSERQRLPLLIYVDDFIAWPGPVQKWLDFHHDLHELADWHGFGYVSYANAFRDVVHADLFGENTFKGKWKMEKRKVVPDPHPGMAFHHLMSWIMSYYVLTLAVQICDGTLLAEDPILDDLNRDTEYITKGLPNIPRPPLSPDLKTEQIPKSWSELETKETGRCESLGTGARCAFVWVANRVSEFRDAKSIQAFLERFMTDNNNWKAEGNSYRSKHGWVAKKAGAKFTLKVADLDVEVRFLTILSLKSYGDDWAGTRLRIRAKEQEFELVGFHNSTTSVIIPHKFDLGETVKKGETLEVLFDLIGGETFKITGMAFCSH